MREQGDRRRELLIFGAGGLAREIAYLASGAVGADGIGEWSVAGLIDRDAVRIGSIVGGYRIVACDADVAGLDPGTFLSIGIGVPAAARRIGTAAFAGKFEWPNLRHPGASGDWPRIQLGKGNRICAGVALTTDIMIGDHTLLNLNCTVGHDTKLGSYCVVNPGALISGSVTIGDGVLVGTGAVILQGVTIGENATIGAGAVVTKDVPADVTVVGVPAKPLSRVGEGQR